MFESQITLFWTVIWFRIRWNLGEICTKSVQHLGNILHNSPFRIIEIWNCIIIFVCDAFCVFLLHVPSCHIWYISTSLSLHNLIDWYESEHAMLYGLIHHEMAQDFQYRVEVEIYVNDRSQIRHQEAIIEISQPHVNKTVILRHKSAKSSGYWNFVIFEDVFSDRLFEVWAIRGLNRF